MKLKHLLIMMGLLLPTVVLCQKKEYKQGLAFEEIGELALAIERYKAALYKNMYFEKAKSALKQCADQKVGHLLTDYFVAREKRNWEEAQRIAQLVADLKNEMKYFSIDVVLPDYQETRFEEDQERLLDQRFKSAHKEYQSKNYKQAKEQLYGILKESEFHKASLQLLDSIENLETEEIASRAFISENYFLAYDLYSTLLVSHPEHSGYIDRLNQSKTRGSMSVALVDLIDFEDQWSATLKTAVLSEIAKWQHPLLTMVEREDLDILIREQKQVFTGLFDESTTSSPGMLKGVKHLLMIRLEDIEYEETPLKTMRLTAYEKVQSKVFDEAGNWRINTEFSPRHYTEEIEGASMTASLHYKLLEVETGKILIANKVTGQVGDEIFIANYAGDPNTLLPTRNDKIIQSGPYLGEFRASFNNQTILKSKSRLFTELEIQLAADIMIGIKGYLLGGRP